MNKFVISKILSQNLLSLQRFCSRIFGVTSTQPNKKVEKILDENKTNNINDNKISESNKIDENPKNNLVKIAYDKNLNKNTMLPPVTINDIEDEFEDFEDFFEDTNFNNNIIKPFNSNVLQMTNDKLIKPIDNNLLKLHLPSDIIDNITEDCDNDFENSNQDINLIYNGHNFEVQTDNENKQNLKSNESTNDKLSKSINYDILRLHLSPEIMDDIVDEYDISSDDVKNDGIKYEPNYQNDKNISKNINTTKLNDIIRPVRNIFLKNHSEPISMYDIADEYEDDDDDEDFFKNCENKTNSPLKEDDIIKQMKNIIQQQIESPTQPQMQPLIQHSENDNIKQLKTEENVTESKAEEIIPLKKEGILKYHLPPVNVGGEDDDELLDDDPEEDEILKRCGEYKSHGIKVYIPENKMPAGTIRYQLDKIPDGMPDDIRVIHYD